MATVTWQGDVDNNWSTNLNWDTNTKPTTGDDVVFSNAVNCVVDEATADLKSFDMTGYTGTLSGSSNITVTVASGTSTVKFAGTSPTWSGTLLLNPAAGTTINLTMGSLTTAGTIGGITIAGTTTGAVYFLDGVTMGATKIVTLTSGTLHTDGATDNSGLTHSWGKFSSDNSNTRTLTLGTSTIGITGTGTAWDMSTKTNLTVSANTASITFSGASAGGYFGGATYGGIVAFTGSGEAVLAGAGSTFATLTRTGTNIKTDTLRINYYMTITAALNLNGNSTTNRILVYGQTLGTAVTLTVTGATVSTNNVDFRDITFARTDAGGLDLTNGGANLIGDCGGNSRTGGDGTVTFTTSRTNNFITAAGGNWADVANWDTATDADRVPLPQDDVTFATAFNSGVTITANMPRLGRSIDFSGATATGAGVLPTFALGNAVTNYGSLNLTGLKSSGFSGSYYLYLESQARSGTSYLTSNGQSFPSNVYVQTVGATLQLADAFVNGSVRYLTVYNGIFVDAGYSVSTGRFYSGGTYIRAVTKTGNWTLQYATEVAIFSLATTGLTWSDTAGTITISDTGSSTKTFAGAGQTFNNLTIAGGGTGAIIFTGANTFNDFTIGYPKTVKFTQGTNTTINGTFSATGIDGSRITLTSVNGVDPFTITSGGGVQTNDYLDVYLSAGSPASTWYYGTNGTGDAYSQANGWGVTASNGNFFLMFN